LVLALSDEVQKRLDVQNDITAKAAQGILETLENYVRTGWLLAEIKSEFRKFPGAFDDFVEHRFNVEVAQINNYIRVANQFQKDRQALIESSELKQTLGVTDSLIDEDITELSLQDQLIEVSPNSFSDLLRRASLAKPRLVKDRTPDLIPSPNIRQSYLKLGKSITTTVVRLNRIDKEDAIANWTPEEKASLKRDLEPLMDLYKNL
jgi:hypothetical protein